jgi:hypothetical protein
MNYRTLCIRTTLLLHAALIASLEFPLDSLSLSKLCSARSSNLLACDLHRVSLASTIFTQ